MRTPQRVGLWGSHALTNSIEFRHAKDVKTLELSWNLKKAYYKLYRSTDSN
jgi:hypothetical protein